MDLPIIFFGFSGLGLVLSLVSINTIGILSSLSLPIIIYSIYVQKKFLNKWCILCLLISMILITNTFLFWLFKLGFGTYVISEILLIFPIAILWLYIKKLLKTNQKNKTEINKLLQIKRNEDVFNAITTYVMYNEEFLSLPKITLGNTNAPNTLTIFLTPSCPHCHIAFKEALVFLEKHDEKLKIEIAYNLNINNIENPYLDIAKTIMQLFNQNKDYKSALIDWHINNLDMALWKSKWIQNENFVIENEQLEKQLNWCLKNKFNYAPIIIFNRKLLPQVYHIDEIFYFFKEEN